METFVIRFGRSNKRYIVLNRLIYYFQMLRAEVWRCTKVLITPSYKTPLWRPWHVLWYGLLVYWFSNQSFDFETRLWQTETLVRFPLGFRTVDVVIFRVLTFALYYKLYATRIGLLNMLARNFHYRNFENYYQLLNAFNVTHYY